MPRVTKAMLEVRLEYFSKVIDAKNHEIDLLKKEVELLRSPYTSGGYLSVLAIAAERLGDAMAHVVGDLKKKTYL